MSAPKVSIIIAAYNEQDTIANAVAQVHQVLPGAEIIIVDDGSQDATLAKARALEGPLVRVVAYAHNRGKGYAIRRGIEAATAPLMAQLDADLQFPPQGLPELLRPIEAGRADIVFGSRYLSNTRIEQGSVSLIKRLASWVMAMIVTVFCRQRYTDVFAGFKAWRSDVVRALDIQEDGFTYEAEIAIKAKRQGFKVIEIPTRYSKRFHGQSKIRIIYHTATIGWRVLCLGFGQ